MMAESADHAVTAERVQSAESISDAGWGWRVNGGAKSVKNAALIGRYDGTYWVDFLLWFDLEDSLLVESEDFYEQEKLSGEFGVLVKDDDYREEVNHALMRIAGGYLGRALPESPLETRLGLLYREELARVLLTALSRAEAPWQLLQEVPYAGQDVFESVPRRIEIFFDALCQDAVLERFEEQRSALESGCRSWRASAHVATFRR